MLVRRRLRSHFAGRRQGLFRLAGALQHNRTQRKCDVHAGVLLRARAPAGADASAAAGAGAEGRQTHAAPLCCAARAPHLDDGVDGLERQLIVAAVHCIVHRPQLTLHNFLRRSQRLGSCALASGRHAGGGAAARRAAAKAASDGVKKWLQLSNDVRRLLVSIVAGRVVNFYCCALLCFALRRSMAAAEAEQTLLDLPALLQMEVLRHAGAAATASAAATCRSLREVSAHPLLWQAHFTQELQPLRGAHDGGVTAPRSWHRFFNSWKSGAPAHTTACATDGLRGVTAVAFVGADTLYSAHECGRLVEWNTARGGFETSRVVAAHGGAGLNALAECGPATVATAGVDNAVRLWDVRASPAAPAMQLLDAHSGEVFSVASLTGKADATPLLASGGGDEQVRIWDARFAAEALLELNGCSSSVFALAHDATAQRLYAGARRDICLFDLRDGAWLTNLQGHSHDVYGIALGATRLLSCGDDGRVCSWRRQPPLSSDEEEVEEELQPSDEEVITRQGDLGDAVSVTCLIGLGREPTAFLAGTWDGDVVLGAFDGARRRRTFGDALLRTDGDHAQRFDAVTALAACDDVVAVGHNSGALRLMRME